MGKFVLIVILTFAVAACKDDSCASLSAQKAYEGMKREIEFDSAKFLSGRDTFTKYEAVYVCTCHPDSEARQEAAYWLSRIGYKIKPKQK